MATSEKRVAANRVNASKSTGPRTPAGKRRACLNAVTHGLTAQTSVLPGEDADELERLSDSLMKQLKPRGVVQRIIAERVVSLAWKLRRVARAEESVAREMEDTVQRRWKKGKEMAAAEPMYRRFVGPRPVGRDAGQLLAHAMWIAAEKGMGDYQDLRLPRLTEYELKLDAALRAGMRELLRLQKDAGAFEEVEEEQAPRHPEPPEAVTPDVVSAPDAPDAPGEVAGEARGAVSGASAGENEPNAEGVAEQGRGEEPGLRGAAPASGGEAPVDETNPLTRACERAQDAVAPAVTRGPGAESSAPVPGTFSSPPPAPRP